MLEHCGFVCDVLLKVGSVGDVIKQGGFVCYELQNSVSVCDVL